MTRARNSANLASHGNLFVDITNDRTGIGSVVPGQSLHIAGTAGFHGDTTFTGDLYNTTWDRSDNSLKFVDNAKAKFGTGEDLEIYHSSNTNIIDSGSANFTLVHGEDSMIQALHDAQVELFHNGNKKFETTVYGTNTIGTAVNDGLVVAGVATVTTMNVTGVLTYDDVTSVDSVGIVTARQGVRVTADGSNTTNYISVGAGDDLRLFHDGTNTYIKNNTGDLYLKSSSADYIRCVNSTGAVELYWNNGLRFSTDNQGILLPNEKGVSFGDIGCKIYGKNGSGANNGIFFMANSGNAWQIDGNKHFKPMADSSYDIGLTGTRVRNIYADTLYGDGSNLTGITQTTINGNTNNRIITATGTANTLQGESNLTFDGTGLLTQSGSGTASIMRVETTANDGDALIQADGRDGSGNLRRIMMRTDAGADQYRIISSDTSYNLALCTGNAPRVLIAGNSAATSIGGSNVFNAMLTVQGDISGQLFTLKATENTTRLMVSGTDGNGVEMNLYDEAGGQKGILGVSGTEFFIKAPNNSAPLTFYTHNGSSIGERLRITSGGNVGINENSPDKILHISHVSSPTIRLENTDTSLTSGQVVGNIEFKATDPSGIGANVIGSVESFSDSSVGGSYGLKFRVSTSSSANYEAMRIAQNGNVSLGGQTPDTAFHIEKLTPELRVQSTNTNLGQGGTVCTFSHHTSDPTTPTGVGEVFRIKTYSANSNGADYTTELVSRAGSGGGESRIALGQSAVGAITFSTHASGSAVDRLRIKSDGTIRTGNTDGISSTGIQLQVNNPDAAGAQMQFTDTGTGATTVSRGFRVGYNGSGGQLWNFENTYLRFATNNNERLRIANSGHILVGDGNTYTPGARVHLHGGTTGAQQLRVQNHTSVGSFSGNYGSEFRHAYSSVNHCMLIHAEETAVGRRTLDISNYNGIFASFTHGKMGLGTGITSPNGTLDIRTADDDDAIRLVNTSTGNNGIQWWNEYGGLTKRVSMDYGENDANFDIRCFRGDAQNDRPYGNVRILTGSYSSPNMNFRVTTLGSVHQPNQPAFMVRDSVSSNAFGSNTVANFDTVILNRGSHYNTSNGRFTVPIAGTYLFICNMLSNGSNRLFHEVRKNGSQVTGTRTESGTGAGQYQSNTTQAILELAYGDYIEIFVGSGGAYGGSFSSFSGYLLG